MSVTSMPLPDVTDDDPNLLELIMMADMYASKCTKQYEKFDYYQRNGIKWRWEDCEAAWELLRERSDGWLLQRNWRKGLPLTTPF